eukprot:scaffold270106_cov40-Tisochrysis_lutea.AAC.2
MPFAIELNAQMYACRSEVDIPPSHSKASSACTGATSRGVYAWSKAERLELSFANAPSSL